LTRALGAGEGAEPPCAPGAVRNRWYDKDPARAPMGDEALHAVENVITIPAHGGRSRAAGIAARVRFGEAKSAHHTSRCEQWNIAPLLVLIPEAHDGRSPKRRVRRDR